MSTEVSKSSMGLSTERFKATATGLIVDGDPTYDEWYEFGQKLARVDGAIQWWIGDWAAAEGRVVNGVKSEAYTMLEEETGLARKTVQQCKWIAENVDLSARVESLSFKHHEIVASLPTDNQKRWLQKAADEELTVAQLRREIKAEKYQDPELPEGKYRIIYIDPPWEYGAEQHGTTQGRTAHAIGSQDTVLETHYPTMTLDQLKAMDIPSICLDDCVMWMWATVPLLPAAMELGEHWGFSYKTHMVWDKVKHNVGNYVSVRHELLLIFGKGSSTPDVGELVDSVYEEERTEHSRKPAYFRNLIDTLYPHGRRGEAFSRADLPKNWEALTKDVER